jgi:RHS repeat-associated protein
VYTLEPASFGNLISQRRASATQYFHFDGLGSADRITNGSGNVIVNYVYYAFGMAKTSSGNAPNSFQYVGHQGYYVDSDIASYYVRARHYDPAVGRFISFDPMSFQAGDYNLYRYVVNNPANLIDPSGLAYKLTAKQFKREALQCGSVLYQSLWELDHRTPIGSTRYVIQQVDYKWNVTCCTKQMAIDPNEYFKKWYDMNPRFFDTAWYPYLEAFEFRGFRRYSKWGVQSNYRFDDQITAPSFNLVDKPATYGELNVKTIAGFYRYGSLAPGWIVRGQGMPPSGLLPAVVPAGSIDVLKAALDSNQVIRTIKVKWNCCAGPMKSELTGP